MAITLETLVLEYKADFREFDRQLDTAIAKAERKGRQLERTPFKLKPTIDPSQLESIKRQLNQAFVLSNTPLLRDLSLASNIRPSTRSTASFSGSEARSQGKIDASTNTKETQQKDNLPIISIVNIFSQSFKRQEQLLVGLIGETKNTQTSIKKESAVSFGNLVKSKFQESTISGVSK
ncbi:MAG: hypothetical protein AB4372_38745, partial [Xenococcus sp. (in: cyanobacteria)]